MQHGDNAKKVFIRRVRSWDGKASILAPQSANASTDMVNLTETAITNGADIIMPCVADPDMFADVLARAKDAGIIVVGLAAGDGGVSCDAEIGTDPVNLGKKLLKLGEGNSGR